MLPHCAHGGTHLPLLTMTLTLARVAGAYQRMGLLSTHRHANDYLPRDFTASHSRHLELLDSAWLGPERKVGLNRAAP